MARLCHRKSPLLLLLLLRACSGARSSLWAGVRPPATPQTSVEVLSWEPRAFRFRDFLSAAECQYLIEQARPHMEQSTVVDTKTGESVPSDVRTSSGTFLVRGASDVISAIEKRIAVLTGIPAENGEGLQILHYQKDEQYQPHFDYFNDESNTHQKNGGQRLATVLMYLSDVEEGGETVFPHSTTKPTAGDAGFSECARRGVAIKPQRGDALFFFSLSPQGANDPQSLHGGCPVIRGDKWSATKWMRTGEYDAPLA